MYFLASNSLLSIQSGCNSLDAGYLNLTNNTWSAKSAVTDTPIVALKGKALHDPTTGNLWLVGAQGATDNIYEFDPSSNTWYCRKVNLGIAADSYQASQAILDWVNRKIILVGAGQYYTIDISTPASWTEDVGGGVMTGMPASCIDKTNTYTGNADLVTWVDTAQPGFGLKYDPNTGLAFGWSSNAESRTQSDIYILCPKTNHFIKHPSAAGSPTPTAESTQTLHGRMQVLWNQTQPIIAANYMKASPETYYHWVYKLSMSKTDHDTPVVTFTAPTTAASTTITLESMAATDATSIIAGYAITTGPVPRKLNTAAWSDIPLTTYEVATAGVWDLYAWAYDIYGNVSAPVVQTVEVACTVKTVASSGGDYTDIRSAIVWANTNGPGSIIEIDAADNPWNSWRTSAVGACTSQETDDYDNVPGDVTGSGITIRGINGVAKLDWLCGHAPTNSTDDRSIGTANTTNGAMICLKNGVVNFRLENIEITGVGYDGAGLRVETITGQLYIKGCVFDENSYGGLLTGIKETGLVIDIVNSEFYNNARFYVNNGQIHNIYVGEVDRFTFFNSKSWDAYQGQLVKTRAKENYILYSQILDKGAGLCATEGSSSNINLDICYGRPAYVIGNTFSKSDLSLSPEFIGYNTEQRFTAYFSTGGAAQPVENSTVFTNTRTSKTWTPKYIYSITAYGFTGAWASSDKTGAIVITGANSLYADPAPHVDIVAGDTLTYTGGSITIVESPAGGETIGEHLEYSWGITAAEKAANGIYVVNNTFVDYWQQGVSPSVAVYTFYDREFSVAKNNIFVDLTGSESYPFIMDAGIGTTDTNNLWTTSDPGFTSIGTYDYSLTVGATGAIDDGLWTAPIEVDLNPNMEYTGSTLKTRQLYGTSMDLGAYEFAGGTVYKHVTLGGTKSFGVTSGTKTLFLWE
jgi:hypothetical protein